MTLIEIEAEGVGMSRPSEPYTKGEKPDAKTALRVEMETFAVNPYDLMRRYVALAVDSEGGNKSEAARKLGMHRRTLQRIMAGSP